MDNSLTNLMNESQNEEDKYLLELNINDENRINTKNVLFLLGFLINSFILFTNNIFANILLYIFSLIITTIGISITYKNNNYIKNNLILFSIYIISIIFEIILIFYNNNNSINILSLFITILYQITYIVNYE
tara:strand:+ start:174 stop:569 length:396 start_codon:yes stop_codon:yes gene_type:complete